MDCILSGVGGQGTVLASKLIAHTALKSGETVRTAETIGMAQRGGCVVSHVRVGDKAYSPLVPHKQADLIIAFEPAEAVRCLPYLKKDGFIVLSTKGVQPVTSALTGIAYDGTNMLDYLESSGYNFIAVDGEEICNNIGSPKVLNIVLLGAAQASGKLGMSLEQLESSINDVLSEKFIPMNLKALKAGYVAVKGNK